MCVSLRLSYSFVLIKFMTREKEKAAGSMPLTGSSADPPGLTFQELSQPHPGRKRFPCPSFCLKICVRASCWRILLADSHLLHGTIIAKRKRQN